MPPSRWRNKGADVEYHELQHRHPLQKRRILHDHNVSSQRFKFHKVALSVVTPVACFAVGHRSIRKVELSSLDVTCSKFMHYITGPHWNPPWHDIFLWNKTMNVVQ